MGQITVDQAITALKNADIRAARGYPSTWQPNITGVRVAVNVHKREPEKLTLVAAVCQRYQLGAYLCEDVAQKVAQTWSAAGATCTYGAARLDDKAGLYILEVLGVWTEAQAE